MLAEGTGGYTIVAMDSGLAFLEHRTPECRGSWTFRLGEESCWRCSECRMLHRDSAEVRWAVIHEGRFSELINGLGAQGRRLLENRRRHAQRQV